MRSGEARFGGPHLSTEEARCQAGPAFLPETWLNHQVPKVGSEPTLPEGNRILSRA